MIHNMHLNFEPFEAIKSGTKTIEVRLNDEKRRLVKPLDTIIFTKTNSNEQIVVEVVARHEFKTFYQLYERFSFNCGLKHFDINKCVNEIFSGYYTREQEKKYGALGIEIKLKD